MTRDGFCKTLNFEFCNFYKELFKDLVNLNDVFWLIQVTNNAQFVIDPN